MATKKFLKMLVKMTPLNILGTDYDIILHEKKWITTGSPGTVNFPHAKIWLDVSLDDDRIVDILLHEILEVIKDRFTIEELPHTALCAIEFGIMDVLRHNSMFRKAIGMASLGTKGNKYEFKDFRDATGQKKVEISSEEEALAALLKEEKKTKPRKGLKKQKVERVGIGG